MTVKSGMERVYTQWQVTNTSYEKAIIEFGEKRATLVEQGVDVEDARWEAGREDITGRMEERAREFLKSVWEYGEWL